MVLNKKFTNFLAQCISQFNLVFHPPKKKYKDTKDLIDNSTIEDFTFEYAKVRDNNKLCKLSILNEITNKSKFSYEKSKIILDDLSPYNLNEAFKSTIKEDENLSRYILENHKEKIDLDDDRLLKSIIKYCPVILDILLKEDKVKKLIADERIANRITNICIDKKDYASLIFLCENGMHMNNQAKIVKNIKLKQDLEQSLEIKKEPKRKQKI